MEQRILFGDYSPIIFSGVIVRCVSCVMHGPSTLENKSMAERNTDVTTFSKTFQEKQKTFPCDPQDLFQIALLYIDFQTNARDYREDLLVIALLEFVILIAN